MARKGQGGEYNIPTGKWRRWAVAGVIAFVIVDLVLVGWAISSVHASPPSTTVTSSGTALHTTLPPRATPTKTPQAKAVVPDAVVPTRVLAALDDTVAWRATTGACPATPGTLEHTRDGGATWKSSDASKPTGASSVLRIMVSSSTEAAAITLDNKNCTPQYIRTYVSGDNWASYPDQLAGSWYPEPATPASVHSPNGDVATPCGTVVGVAAQDVSSAAILCSNHVVYRTSDSGSSWGTPLDVTGAVAVSATANGYATASTAVKGCAGISVSNFDTGTGAANPAGCFATATPQPGAVAMAAGGSTLWLWAGDASVRSGDGGATWH